MTDFEFKPKRILKHKDHITLNEGDRFDTTVQHLQKTDGQFRELKKNEAARKYGSKKLVRDLDFKSRDGIRTQEDSGLQNTPDWFPQVLPTIPWSDYRTLLYEIDHLWLNMFFVRELYGEEETGREQILELSDEDNGIGVNVLAQLDYDPIYQETEYDKEDVDAVIKVEIVEEEKINEEGETGKEFDVDVDFKQSFWDQEDQSLSSGLREIMTGVCLKHDHTAEQLHLDIQEEESGVFAVEILNKDFAVRFNDSGDLSTGVSPWVVEMLSWDGCPVNVEAVEVKN